MLRGPNQRIRGFASCPAPATRVTGSRFHAQETAALEQSDAPETSLLRCLRSAPGHPVSPLTCSKNRIAQEQRTAVLQELDQLVFDEVNRDRKLRCLVVVHGGLERGLPCPGCDYKKAWRAKTRAGGSAACGKWHRGSRRKSRRPGFHSVLTAKFAASSVLSAAPQRRETHQIRPKPSRLWHVPDLHWQCSQRSAWLRRISRR